MWCGVVCSLYGDDLTGGDLAGCSSRNMVALWGDRKKLRKLTHHFFGPFAQFCSWSPASEVSMGELTLWETWTGLDWTGLDWTLHRMNCT